MTTRAPRFAENVRGGAAVLVLLALAVLALVTGCSDSGGGKSQPSAAAPAAEPSASANVAPRPTDPIAASAYDFLDALLVGDTTRAATHLTPTAQRQLAASQRGFAPPELGPSGFSVGEVRRLSDGEAAVECLVSAPVDGETAEESLVCLLRQVQGAWWIAGLAFEVSPDEPPMIINFEAPVAAQTPEFVDSTPSQSAPQAPRTAAGTDGPISR